MIHYVKIKNFHSIHSSDPNNEFIFDLRLNKKVSEGEMFYESPSGFKISQSQSILGENASGKTNLLKAIGFLQYLVLTKNQNKKLPYLTFAKNEDNSSIEIAFETNNIYYEYFVEFNTDIVLSEILKYKDYNNGNLKELFNRTNNNNSVSVISKDKDLQNEINKLPSMPLWNTYISFVSGFNWNNNNYLKSFYDYFFSQLFTNTHISGDTAVSIRHKNDNINIFDFYNNLDNRVWAVNLFNKINQPVKNISVVKDVIDDNIIKDIKAKMNIPENSIFEIEPGQRAVFTYNFINEFSIDHIYESLGNRKLFDMIPALHKIFNEGKNNVLVYDELDRSLHPELVYFIVSLFNDIDINKTNSQIIFTSHCYSIINELSRHKITFVSKSRKTGETEIYKLSDIEGSDNFTNPYQKYMSGNLGSYPLIKD